MSLICVVSAKGAPGATLTALGLAAAWPVGDGKRKVLVEADPAGGSLAIRFGLGRQPGLVSMAAASAHGMARNDLWSHVQELPGGLGVIVAPERGDRTRAVLNSAGAPIASLLAGLDDVTAIADCGRYTAGDPSGGLIDRADLVLMVAQPMAEQIQPAAALCQHLSSNGSNVAWVLIGDRPHPSDEVALVTGIRVERVLPDDAKGATLLANGNGAARRSGNLARHFSTWAADLAAQLRPPTEAGPELSNAQELIEAGL